MDPNQEQEHYQNQPPAGYPSQQGWPEQQQSQQQPEHHQQHHNNQQPHHNNHESQQQAPWPPQQYQNQGYQQPYPQPNYNQQAPPAPHQTNAGLLVLQWLTYAFWGWTVLALSSLTASVLASFMNDVDTGAFTPYGIAAVLVLLPISYVCDSFYSKKEPRKKAGGEAVVMVIHAVIFALFGIGSVIVAAFTLVQMITSSSDSGDSKVVLASALIIAAYYAITFLRTMNPVAMPWVRRFYKMVMLLTVGLIALLGLVGPVAKERTLRNDKLISNNLYNVSYAISDYVRAKNQLPSSLDELSLNGDTKKLIEKKLVTYKPETGTVIEPSYNTTITGSKTARKYQLCVNYKKESSYYKSSYSGYNRYESDNYVTSPSSYSHPAGDVCYKLKTSIY